MNSPIVVTSAKAHDGAQWDSFVRQFGGGEAWSHAWAWRQVYVCSYNLLPHYLIARKGLEIVGVLPAVYVPSANGRRTLVSLPYLDYAGPIAMDDVAADHLRRKAASDSEAYVERGLGHVLPLPATSGKIVTMRLALPRNHEQLWKGFKSKVRNQCRKSEVHGVKIIEGPEGLEPFYRIWSRRMQQLGTPAHSLAWFSAILDHIDGAKIYIAEDDGVAKGGLMVLSSGSIACGPWAASATDARALSLPNALYWRAIRDGCEQGQVTFDFLRSTVDQGTYQFKKQWGAIPQVLLYRKFCNADVQTDVGYGGGRVQMAVQRVWPHLPSSLVNLVGPILRKYIP